MSVFNDRYMLLNPRNTIKEKKIRMCLGKYSCEIEFHLEFDLIGLKFAIMKI